MTTLWEQELQNLVEEWQEYLPTQNVTARVSVEFNDQFEFRLRVITEVGTIGCLSGWRSVVSGSHKAEGMLEYWLRNREFETEDWD